MKTAIALLACWIAALAVWVAYIELAFGENWGETAAFLRAALLLGAPRVIVASLVHLPILNWLARSSATGVARPVLAAGTSGLISLPLVSWPVFVLSGSLRDWTGGIEPFGPLYVTFGILFGGWHAAFRRPSRRMP